MARTDPDADLKRRVRQYLHDRHMPGLRRLSIDAQGGVVTVRGKVRTFYERQLCQHICRRVAGVLRVVDEVEVEEPQEEHAELCGAGANS